MSAKRNITRDDIFVKARVLAEGVRREVKGQPDSGPLYRPMILDGCELVVALPQNPYSRLEAVIEGEDVTVSDMGEVLGRGRLQKRYDWLDTPLSNGQPASTGLPGMSAQIINIIQNHRCYNQDTGQACRYCGQFTGSRAGGVSVLSGDAFEQGARHQAEAVKVATDNGWRGTLVLAGGVLPPARRDELTDRIATVLTPIREMLDEDVFGSLHIAINSYPPSDFTEMYKWRDLGVNSSHFDLEVMDPAYFKAICPAKSAAYPQEYWKEAQIASTEIFGRGRGTVTAVVTGIEPMTSLVEGVEERISRGVFTTPLHFHQAAGAAYEQFRPPTAPWYQEATEKIVDSYQRHADKLDVDPFADPRPGFTRTGRSFFVMLLGDEIARRAQEMGKLPPGLPSQTFCEP